MFEIYLGEKNIFLLIEKENKILEIYKNIRNKIIINL